MCVDLFGSKLGYETIMFTLLLPYIIVLILSFPLVTLLHELAHYVAAKRVGYTILSFKPWPHYNKEKDIFFFGSVSYNYPEGLDEVTKLKNEILVSSAPLWTSFVLAGVWFGISLFTWLPLASIGIAHTIDASWWWIHLMLGDAHADGRKWWVAWQKLRRM